MFVQKGSRWFLLLLLLIAVVAATSNAANVGKNDKASAKAEKKEKKKNKVTVGPEKSKKTKAVYVDEDREQRKERKKKERENRKTEKLEDKANKQKKKEKLKIAKVERKEAFKRAKLKVRKPLTDEADLKEKLKAKAWNKLKNKLNNDKSLNRKEKKEIAKIELETFKEMRQKGISEISNSKEAFLMREYRLRNKKQKGLFRKKKKSLAQILFPGVGPEDYKFKEPIWVYADMVDSRLTPVPFDVYDLPGYVEKKEGNRVKRFRKKRNLGSRLQGHDLKPAPFIFETKVDTPCTKFGNSFMSPRTLRWMRQLVERQYRVHLELDGLPVLLKMTELNFALRGYPIGFTMPDSKELYLYNHLTFIVTYHEDPQRYQGTRITGFEVYPVSIKHDNSLTCQGVGVNNNASKDSSFLNPTLTQPFQMKAEANTPIVFSYDVTWVSEDVEWADRWDVYLIGAPDDEVHFYSIMNSLMIVLIMTCAISTIMVRTLRKDIAGYNNLLYLEEGEDETGWKLLHGDVFRPPSFSPMLLSVFVGTGAQVGIASVCAILLSIAHITNTLKKGQMLTSLILLYALAGIISGYISSRVYKFSQGKRWKMNTILTSTALPAACFSTFVMLNVFLSRVHAATAVSFWTVLCLFLIWVCLSTPLVFLGSFLALRGKGIEVNIKTNSIARIIPGTLWSVAPVVIALIGGLLPFGSVSIELTFIMSALWLHQIYYFMGFLLAVGCILCLTCAQVSIVTCYLQFCAEDHRWWWKSFWNCATAGIYLFVYTLYFLFTKIHMVGTLPVFIYLTYMSIICACFGLFCGAVGFLSSLWFTKKIYGSVKLD